VKVSSESVHAFGSYRETHTYNTNAEPHFARSVASIKANVKQWSPAKYDSITSAYV